jgi:DNA-binding NarL/FixJ family response regulator
LANGLGLDAPADRLAAEPDARVKGVQPRELFQAIREVAGGGHALPPVSADLLDAAALALVPEDRPILDMLVERKPMNEMAEALSLDVAELKQRIMRMLGRLKVSVPVP